MSLKPSNNRKHHTNFEHFPLKWKGTEKGNEIMFHQNEILWKSKRIQIEPNKCINIFIMENNPKSNWHFRIGFIENVNSLMQLSTYWCHQAMSKYLRLGFFFSISSVYYRCIFRPKNMSDWKFIWFVRPIASDASVILLQNLTLA